MERYSVPVDCCTSCYCKHNEAVCTRTVKRCAAAVCFVACAAAVLLTLLLT